MFEVEKRPLGRTGMTVSRLGFGTTEIAGAAHGRNVSEADCERILNLVLDRGINFIDTSIDYGLAETRIGRYISYRRSEFYLATKCGCLLDSPLERRPGLLNYLRPHLYNTPPWRLVRSLVRRRWAAPVTHVYTARNIIEGVEQSLRRLRTEYIDVLQFHLSPSRQVLEQEGGLEAALSLKQAGKVRFLGMSSSPEDIEDHIAMNVFDVFQLRHSVFDRSADAALEQLSGIGAGTLIRGAAERRHRSRKQMEALWKQSGLDEVRGAISRREFLLRYPLGNAGVGSLLIGTISPQHLEDNLRTVAAGPLPAELHRAASRLAINEPRTIP